MKTTTNSPSLASKIQDDRIMGEVLFSDRFGNLITNIPKPYLLGKVVKFVEFKGHRLPLLRTFSDVSKGEALSLIGSFDLLEIALREGNAREHFEAREGELVVVFMK